MEICFKVKNLPEQSLKQQARKIFTAFKHEEPVFKESEVNLFFIGSLRMKKINFLHRKKNKDTDVLSFPMHSPLKKGIFLGDILISKKFLRGNILEKFSLFFVHGLYHLIGYDHQTDKEYVQMKTKETQLLKKVNIYVD